jgi:hypothetical protein
MDSHRTERRARRHFDSNGAPARQISTELDLSMARSTDHTFYFLSRKALPQSCAEVVKNAVRIT